MALTKVGKEGITGISNSSDATAITIDSSENVGIGESSPDTTLHIRGTSTTTYDATAVGGQNTTGTLKIENTSNDANVFTAIDFNTNNNRIVNRIVSGHGTSTSNGFLAFVTEGGGTPAEAMRIDSSGGVLIGTVDTSVYNNSGSGNGGVNIGVAGDSAVKGFIAAARDDGTPLDVNRLASDGGLVDFRQDGSKEGTISVSGTTVSYNGGHLSRWSQFTDGNRISGLVKGTVMTNLNQMAEWTKDGVTEENEQLNCMAVSSVEGDVNVAGVFVNWDDDDTDYTADMNIAMTGDMVIRIAQGTTVARGDLLMSAGDGTAKPQGDDIVRSKTIAKVTSTTVSHTYDDGTFLVPCVLMAC